MSKAQRYGTTEIEEHAEQSQRAHEIVQEILNFGVTQKQLLLIIKRLALNLENGSHMKQLAKLADKCIKDGLITTASSGKSPILNE